MAASIEKTLLEQNSFLTKKNLKKSCSGQVWTYSFKMWIDLFIFFILENLKSDVDTDLKRVNCGYKTHFILNIGFENLAKKILQDSRIIYWNVSIRINQQYQFEFSVFDLKYSIY